MYKGNLNKGYTINGYAKIITRTLCRKILEMSFYHFSVKVTI